jgi:hypothetical protein
MVSVEVTTVQLASGSSPTSIILALLLVYKLLHKYKGQSTNAKNHAANSQKKYKKHIKQTLERLLCALCDADFGSPQAIL